MCLRYLQLVYRGYPPALPCTLVSLFVYSIMIYLTLEVTEGSTIANAHVFRGLKIETCMFFLNRYTIVVSSLCVAPYIPLMTG
jgi:hypothetical protein